MFHRVLIAAASLAAAAALAGPSAAYAQTSPQPESIHYNSLTYQRSTGTWTGTISCGEGEVATGGGYYLGDKKGDNAYVKLNYPSSDNAWTVEAVRFDGWVYVVCHKF